MRECKRHLGSQPGSGVCSSCLEERLTQLWRGESSDQPTAEEIAIPSSAPVEHPDGSSSLQLAGFSQEAVTVVGSIASIRRQLQENGAVTRSLIGDGHTRDADSQIIEASPTSVLLKDLSDVCDHNNKDGGEAAVISVPLSYDLQDIMREWTEFHAKRRSNAGAADLVEEKPVSLQEGLQPPLDEGMSNLIGESKPQVENRIGARSIGSRSIPLVNKTAEETALRVIGEHTDDHFLKEIEVFETAEGLGNFYVDDNVNRMDKEHPVECFSPVWPGSFGSKWVKVLVNPMISSNKVFPSRSKEDLRKSHPAQSWISAIVRNSREGSVQPGESSVAQYEASIPTSGPLLKSNLTMDITVPDGAIEGMPGQILQREATASRLDTSRNAVLSWLQVSTPPEAVA